MEDSAGTANTVDCKEEHSEVQTPQSAEAEQTTSGVESVQTIATATVATVEGTHGDGEASKEDMAAERTATSVDTVTQKKEEEDEEEEQQLMTTSTNKVGVEQLTTTSADDATKEVKDEHEVKGNGGPRSETATAVKEDEGPADGRCGGRAADARGGNLDELMDMGTVDQEEQEAQMKDEEQNTSIDDPAMGMGSASEKEAALALMGSSIEVVKVAMEEPDDHRLQATAQPSRLSPDRDTPSPGLVKVKDEPVDEEYNQELYSSSCSSSAPTDDIKDEPETPKELMISSVFSVEGRSGSARPASRPAPSAAKPGPAPAGHLPSTMYVVCSLCKTFMVKGQTAYQKKGSPELFCSPSCLSSRLQEQRPKNCHTCSKPVLRPSDLIRAPVDGDCVRDFCSPACLPSFNGKGTALPKADSPAPTILPCSVCKKPVAHNKHEVALQGVTHRICSNTCFGRFRTIHQPNVSICATCNKYLASNVLVLRSAGGMQHLCSDVCLGKYKQTCSTALHPCSMCANMRPLSAMLDEKNSQQSVVDLFCTTGCRLAHRIQAISSLGTVLPCDNCQVCKVPAYHLAMSDSTIRNFCSLPCVLSFQEKHHHKTLTGGPTASGTAILSAQDNGATTTTAIASPSSALPHQANTTTSTSTSAAASDLREDTSKSTTHKLYCPICERAFTSLPELVQDKGKAVFLCGLDCAEEFKASHCSPSRCEYCNLLKVPADIKRIGSKNCCFCSEGCKLLYKHELSKQWGSHCRRCSYCFSISRSLVSTRYSGKNEEFCSERCWNHYTLLVQQMARCESCGTRGKLSVTLPLLGAPKRFCRLQCLLKYCSTQMQNRTYGKSSAPSVPVKTLGEAGTQTDAVRVPPPPPVKVLKNKSLLCRPMVQHQEVTCKPDMVDTEVQTDEPIRVVVVPVPVPVYVPVPMAMYSQYCPAPMSMPLPLPVPMMLPVTLDSAEGVVETIRQIKDKMPSDPLEADLILMAEIVAEQQEEREVQERRAREGRGRPPEEREKAKEERGRKKRTRPAEQEKDGLELLNEYINNYGSDLDTEMPENFLGSWEDSSSSIGLLADDRLLSKGKLPAVTDIPVGGSFELHVESPPQEPPPMDIEADMPVDTLEQLEVGRLHKANRPEPKRRGPPGRGRRKAREKKKGRQAPEAPEASRTPRLESKYGIDAWERWVRWRKTQPDLQTPRINSRPLELREDVLRCTTTELSYGLSRFAVEVKRPNGEPYLPDSVFYLCLGIQQHLFENSRVENIFTDVFYSKFSMEITKLLKDFKPSITRSGYIHSRVEEEYLWDCKQLGAYSPIVLLNTLLFFCTKYLGFTTVRQHRRLSFAHFMRCSRNNPDNAKTIFLRFYPPVDVSSATRQPQQSEDGSVAKRSRQDEDKMLDMVENQENPLRCPVRLYEFYLSKCSETVKQRSNVFYLRPERSCVPNSPLWFSGTPLDDATLGGMLTRILSVREMHLRAPPVPPDPPSPPSPPSPGDQG